MPRTKAIQSDVNPANADGQPVVDEKQDSVGTGAGAAPDVSGIPAAGEKAATSGSIAADTEKQDSVVGEQKGGKGSTAAPGMVRVMSASRKGKTIVAVSGKPITFDSTGSADVSKEDALYLESCPGFVVER